MHLDNHELDLSYLIHEMFSSLDIDIWILILPFSTKFMHTLMLIKISFLSCIHFLKWLSYDFNTKFFPTFNNVILISVKLWDWCHVNCLKEEWNYCDYNLYSLVLKWINICITILEWLWYDWNWDSELKYWMVIAMQSLKIVNYFKILLKIEWLEFMLKQININYNFFP